MQAETVDAAAEPPSILWGLDPVFSAHARLFICDILQMSESTQVPGVYFYNQHPVYRVDVLGTVVYRREREDFFCYGVDDGTAVIKCLCWKNELLKEDNGTVGGGGGGGDDPPGGFSVEAELRKLQQLQRERWHLEIGELLRVRGTLKTSRQQEREIMASHFYKVSDHMMALQISWMMELPQLYRECYDKPLQLLTDPSSESPVSRTTTAIKEVLEQKSVSRFRPRELLRLLPESMVAPSADQQQLLKQSLQLLEDEGFVYLKVRSQEQLYHVTSRDKELLASVLDVVREDSRRDKYAEKGVHVLHVLSAVRQRFSLNVSRAALERVLQSLESNSDVVSTSDSYYTVF